MEPEAQGSPQRERTNCVYKDSRFKIQEVFMVHLYRSIHKCLSCYLVQIHQKKDETTYGLFIPCYIFLTSRMFCGPCERWLVKQTKQIHRFSTLDVDYKLVSKIFYEWTWFIDKEMACLELFNIDFFDFPISITLIVVWKNELLVNTVFREAAYSIILVRQSESRICAHPARRMQCVNRLCTECYMDDILCCNQNNPGTLWVNHSWRNCTKYSAGVVINTLNIILLHERFRVSQIWRSCYNSIFFWQ